MNEVLGSNDLDNIGIICRNYQNKIYKIYKTAFLKQLTSNKTVVNSTKAAKSIHRTTHHEVLQNQRHNSLRKKGFAEC